MPENDFNNQINFKQLLERHQRIEIPITQRDYAQGRSTEEEIRKEFLTALYDALLLPPEDKSLPLNLDFIYGSVEGEIDTRFLPLDGQQRLTTLFLLHWYLAWKDGNQDQFLEMFCPNGKGHSKFSYSVRPSSTEFFDMLVKFTPEPSPDNVDSLENLVTDQPWYFRRWRLDPTIQSSLKMLDAIHSRFHDSEGFFSRLVDTERPAITFQLLDLDNFGLSDDLYIKMNARGIPLTAFENFKARFKQVLEKQFGKKTRTIGSQNLPVDEYFSRSMDTKWADFFWCHRNKNTNLYDDAVMNFFRAIALVTRNPEIESKTYLDEMSSLRNDRVKSTYSNFDKMKWLDRKLSETLILLLNLWSSKGTDFANQLPSEKYFNEKLLFEKAITTPTKLSFVEIVQFAAYVEFVRQHENDIDSEAFQEWMRVIFNLSVSRPYDRLADVQGSITGILELVPNSGNILKHFATNEKPARGFYEQQISEEKLKAELILADARWKDLIDQAEGHPYFRGQIEFLLEFCGVAENWKQLGKVDWEVDRHDTFQEQFKIYLRKAESMFNEEGLIDLGSFRWQRALLSLGNYLLPLRQNDSFLVNSSTESTSWKRLLRGTGAAKVPQARKLLQQLWDRLDVDNDISGQLDAIIDGATNLEPWRQQFIHTPKAIEFCENRFIRFDFKDVYLLKRSQMNGKHAELFTFCLYHNQLIDMAKRGCWKPLILEEYEPVVGTLLKPYIQFKYERDGHFLYFDIERSGDQYKIQISRTYLENLPDVNYYLLDNVGFQEQNYWLEREISSDDVQTTLYELAEALTNI